MRRSATRLGIIIGIPVAMLFGAYGVARAFSSTGWTSGETLTAADLNTLVTRINALESHIPTGMVMPFAGSSAPSGFLLCDGSAVSRTTYAALFTAIGVTYGVGDSMTTFNLPDLRGRAPIGAGSGPGLTSRTLAGIGGEETHTLTITEMPAHAHTMGYGGNDSSTVVQGTQRYANFNNDAYHWGSDKSTYNTGGDGAHNNMQPFLALNFIIAY